MPESQFFELEGGARMPRIGFGTWQASDEELEAAVTSALAAGYRHFDGAPVYENEPALGRALNKWIADQPDRRKELFVVTKLAPGGNRPELVLEYFNKSLKNLGLDYIDLYLIHVPFAFKHVPGDLHPKNTDGSLMIDCSTDLIAVWKASDEELEAAVTSALAAGYRHFDGAPVYENEPALGRALNKWIADQPDRRKELFVVTKLAPGGNRPELVLEYFNKSLKNLGLDYIDLYLIHVPFAFKHVPGDLHPKNTDGSLMIDCSTDLIAVWKELQKIKASGKARFVGVSNLNSEQIHRLTAVAKPDCLQVEVHVLCQNHPVIATAKELGIPVVAYSPLGSRGLAEMLATKTGRDYPDLLKLPAVVQTASRHARTPAQVLLRHALQRGLGAIPKSTNPQRIQQNISVWDFELSEAEMTELNALDRGEDGRICDFSFFPGVDKHPEFPFKK